jgi:hypothetical protein
MPRQGPREPWVMSMDYFRDVKLLRRGAVTDKCLKFTAVPNAPLHADVQLQQQGSRR